ncbi:tRNA-modifying enzyme [Sedimentisphaera cyanobacteriorum]|uniref:tRNA-modifying enzyme n=1 Tax=Sedimentisphaera cyanobacteriorum TaxID=1940790 RepID=A0A1Q2HMV9_9BACT|nr:radical SAM protein [Sedimentisphaera cyanobacteriorum]AQQ08690.1 tRNA-modifying enzyme [Sedimentisphaera cyanobacteriorum]
MSEKKQEKFSYVFGPVNSRRLGSSLGVDILPLKTCTQNCIYCQLCMDEPPVIEIKTYAEPDKVIDEVCRRLESGVKVDYVTFSGSGEPTLHKDIGYIIEKLKQKTGKKIAVITNGTMLWKQEVRRRLQQADLVMPSLDGFDQQSFQTINRPHETVTFDKLITGLEQFSREFNGQYWLEVFLIKGINTSLESLEKLKKLVNKIKPDRIQLNTVIRPGAEPSLKALSEKELIKAAKIMGIGHEGLIHYETAETAANAEGIENQVTELLRRRACRKLDIAEGLGTELTLLEPVIEQLEKQELLESFEYNGEVFYKLKSSK